MIITKTERLNLRHINLDDAEFILELLNEPAWIRFIGDREVRTIADAQKYISEKFVASYVKFGFGLYLVESKDERVSLGICGLVKRDSLEDVDIGFAFLERFWSKGYAVESAFAVMNYAQNTLGLKRIVAITTPDNDASAKVLEKIGLRFEKVIKLSTESESNLFVWEKV